MKQMNFSLVMNVSQAMRCLIKLMVLELVWRLSAMVINQCSWYMAKLIYAAIAQWAAQNAHLEISVTLVQLISRCKCRTYSDLEVKTYPIVHQIVPKDITWIWKLMNAYLALKIASTATITNLAWVVTWDSMYMEIIWQKMVNNALHAPKNALTAMSIEIVQWNQNLNQ